ncbi:MAG TPA: 5-(carboxyamino)imidazole ribonucleotide synthase [Acidobacteriaceae bacterium]|nr:5-(carboxyamino)imidazole ribonucleotide synthase [Acidobacteriaceae bacterium]
MNGAEVNHSTDIIFPGATIGILGGGQLGRMTAMAARSLGYRVQVLDPDPSCPARFVVDACFEASWDDTHAAANLARGCDVVTLEIEQIAIASLEAAAQYAPVRPGAKMLAVIQDRILQKNWLAAQHQPLGEFKAVTDVAQLEAAIFAMGGRCFIKSARGGYDGRSQVKFGFNGEAADAHACKSAWKALGERSVVVERAQNLALELSLMVARSARGECKCYPPAINHHEQQILVWSGMPANLPPAITQQAREIALSIAEAFALEGLLAVEMFLTTEGRLLVNELAPRPHNSYHASERACATSQFEQIVRAICNLPLGDVEIVQPAAIANLLGDVWIDAKSETGPRFDAALAIPGVRLHLYEKHLPKRGRKMGHLSAVGATVEDAVARVLEAKAKL